MAISTQLRLLQLSGAFGTVDGTVRDDLQPGTLGARGQQVQDYAEMLSQMASSIKRINGDASWFNNMPAGEFNHTNVQFNNAQSFIVAGADNGDIHFALAADRGDEAGDTWQLKASHEADHKSNLSWQNKFGGSWLDYLVIHPDNALNGSDALMTVGPKLKLTQNEIQNSSGGVGISLSGDGSDVNATAALGTGKLTVGGSGGINGDFESTGIVSTAGFLFQTADNKDVDIRARDDNQGGFGLIKLEDAYCKAGNMSTNYIRLSATTQEWNDLVAANTNTVSIIGAINAAASGAPAGVDKYTKIAAADRLDNAAGVSMKFKAEAVTADGKVEIPYVGTGNSTSTGAAADKPQMGYVNVFEEGNGANQFDGDTTNPVTNAAAFDTLVNSHLKAKRMVMTTTTDIVADQTFTLTPIEGAGSAVVFTAKDTADPGDGEFDMNSTRQDTATKQATEIARAVNAKSGQRFYAASAAAVVTFWMDKQAIPAVVSLAVSDADVGGSLQATPSDAGVHASAAITSALQTDIDSDTLIRVGIKQAQDGAMPGLNVINFDGLTAGIESGPEFTHLEGGGTGNKLDWGSLDLSNITPLSDIPNRADLYLNGQLLISGSGIYGPASNADYIFIGASTDTNVVFGFSLDPDDQLVVTVR